MWWIVNNCDSHQECMSRALCDDWCFTIGQWATMKGHSIDSRLAQFHNQQRKTPNDPIRGPVWYMVMDQYLLISFLVGWTSIYQLFWCEQKGYKVLTHCHLTTAQFKMFKEVADSFSNWNSSTFSDWGCHWTIVVSSKKTEKWFLITILLGFDFSICRGVARMTNQCHRMVHFTSKSAGTSVWSKPWSKKKDLSNKVNFCLMCVPGKLVITY